MESPCVKACIRSAGPSKEPTTAWSFDQTANGSNIFRSTKENIYCRRGKRKRKEYRYIGRHATFRAWIDAQYTLLVADYNNAGRDTYLVSMHRKDTGLYAKVTP